MGHRNDGNPVFLCAIDDAVRKATKEIAPGAMIVRRPPVRVITDQSDHPIQFGDKGFTGSGILICVPLSSRPGFGDRVRVKLKRDGIHSIDP